MAKTTPTLNGTVVPATGITQNVIKYGTEIRAADGTLYQTIRGQKSEWSIACEGITSGQVWALKVLVSSNASMPWVDEEGISYTVVASMDDPYTHDVEQGGSERTYDVTLQLKQV